MLLALSSLLGAPGGIPSFNRLLVRAASDFAARFRALATSQPWKSLDDVKL